MAWQRKRRGCLPEERAEKYPTTASRLPLCPLGHEIQVGGHRQANQAGRILTRPVQKIKAGQLALALALALLCGDGSGAG